MDEGSTSSPFDSSLLVTSSLTLIFFDLLVLDLVFSGFFPCGLTDEHTPDDGEGGLASGTGCESKACTKLNRITMDYFFGANFETLAYSL